MRSLPGVTICIFVVLFGVLGCERKSNQIHVTLYTCKLCGSTKRITSQYGPDGQRRILGETITYMSPTYATCNHQWVQGISTAIPERVSDGTVVLVRKGHIYGAFILLNQMVDPERTEFLWYYRTDGQGNLGEGPPTVHSGRGRAGPIKFGPFEVSWSGAEDGKGWLYYWKLPGQEVGPHDLRICVTEHTDVEDLDASAPEWLFKGSPTDPGIRGDEN